MDLATENHGLPLTPEEMLAKARMGKKTVSDIHWGALVIPVRVLSQDEVNAIRRYAKAQAAKVGGDETDVNVEIQKATLKLASTLTPGGGPFLSDPILNKATFDELGYLFSEYIRFMDAVNPSLEHITPEAFRSLVDALKKNLASPNDCTLLQLKAICRAYVDLILRLETQTSQAGS